MTQINDDPVPRLAEVLIKGCPNCKKYWVHGQHGDVIHLRYNAPSLTTQQICPDCLRQLMTPNIFQCSLCKRYWLWADKMIREPQIQYLESPRGEFEYLGPPTEGTRIMANACPSFCR